MKHLTGHDLTDQFGGIIVGSMRVVAEAGALSLSGPAGRAGLSNGVFEDGNGVGEVDIAIVVERDDRREPRLALAVHRAGPADRMDRRNVRRVGVDQTGGKLPRQFQLRQGARVDRLAGPPMDVQFRLGPLRCRVRPFAAARNDQGCRSE